jgi:drug/metabolite transporter (DMT)-like permease
MLFILSAIFLWSSLGLVIRMSGLPVHILIFFSCLISTAIIFPLLISQPFRRELPRGRGAALFLLLGPLSLINSFSFFYAYQTTTIANAVLTHYTAPILVAFFAPFFLPERLTARVLVAVGLATTGLWLLLGVSPTRFLSLLMSGNRETVGILAGLLSGVAYAAVVIIVRIAAQRTHPLVMTFFQNLAIVVLLLPFAHLPPPGTAGLVALGIMGVIHSTVAPVLYFRGMKDVSANTAAILGYLEPISAILLGAVFLGEPLTLRTLGGGALILASGFLTLRGASGRSSL